MVEQSGLAVRVTLGRSSSDQWKWEGDVAAQLDRGVMSGAGRREDSAEVGRAHTGRTMP